MLLRLVAAIFLCVVVIESAKLDRCELVRLLKVREVPPDDIQKFVCLAEQVGDTSKRVDNHFGVFRILSDFWCASVGSANGCKINCEKLLDDDLDDDVTCALTIFKMHKRNNGNGFSAWARWVGKCETVNTDYSTGCNSGTSELSDIFVRFGGGSRVKNV